MTPNDFGTFHLTDLCEQISIKTLLKKVYNRLKRELLLSEIEMAGYEVHLKVTNTGKGGVRYWFSCPQCQRSCGVLYRHPTNTKVGCRTCLNLKYRKSAKKGMIEGNINL